MKIIKKYDKRTGALVRLPFIQEVLNQPFYKTDVLNKLVKECEAMLSDIFPKSDCPGESSCLMEEDGCGSMTGTENENKEALEQVPKELAEIEHMENMLTQGSTKIIE